MIEQGRKHSKGSLFPVDSLCGKCQELVPEGATEGRCLAKTLRDKNRRRLSKSPWAMRPMIQRMSTNYDRIATEIWGCKIVSLQEDQG